MYKFLFEPIYALSEIGILRELAIWLSNQITYLLIFFCLFWALFYARRKIYSFSLIFLTGISAWFLASLIKVFFRIPRPFVALDFVPVQMDSGFSFPSNHATVVMALALSVYFLNRRLGKVLLLVALLIGVSRVVLGVHYPLDVLAGFGLGYLVHLMYKRIFNRF